MDRSARRKAGIAFVGVALAAVSACSSTSSNNSATGGSSTAPPASSTAPVASTSTSASASASPCGTTEPTTVTIGLFGTFGYKEDGLYDAYKQVCPRSAAALRRLNTVLVDHWGR